MKRVFIEIIIFILLEILVMSFFYKKDIDVSSMIYQNKKDIYTFSDSVNNGGSGIDSVLIQKNKLYLKLHIKKDKFHQFPYCGIGLFFNNKNGIHLENYSKLTFSFFSKYNWKYKINIGTYDSNTQILNGPMKYVYSEKIFSDNSVVHEYILNFKDFYIPTWWYESSNVKISNIRQNFKKVMFLQFGNAQYPDDSSKIVNDDIFIKDIKFKSNNEFMIYMALFVIFLFVFYILLIYYIIPLVKRKNYKLDEKEKKLLEFISKNYYKNDLNLDILSSNFGLSKQNISVIFNNKLNIGFKQYVNELRINEAIRLLNETELSIADICYNVGYNNLVHFNRVFKQYYTVSPTEYRKQNEK